MKHITFAIITSVALGFASTANAMSAKQKVEKEITRTQADGTVVTELVEASMVTPGEKVVYTLDVHNTNAEPATDLVLAMPVPVHVKYIEGSADRVGASVKYSADGGQTYTRRDDLQVPSAAGGMRAANADDITHIQWIITGPINTGQTDAVRFKARLR